MDGQTLGVWLPRLVAPFAAWLVAWAAQKGFTLNEAEVITLMLTIYGATHRAMSKKMNPGDAAKSVIVAEDKATVKVQETKEHELVK